MKKPSDKKELLKRLMQAFTVSYDEQGYADAIVDDMSWRDLMRVSLFLEGASFADTALRCKWRTPEEFHTALHDLSMKVNKAMADRRVMENSNDNDA